MAKFLFCILLDFLEVLYFLLLVMPRDFVARCATSCIEARLRSLLRTYERSTCSKSSILFTETNSRQMKKERHQYPVILTEQAWSKKGLFILWTSYLSFDSQRFVLLLFSNLRVDWQATKTLIYLIFSLSLPSVLCVNAKRSHGLSSGAPWVRKFGKLSI